MKTSNQLIQASLSSQEIEYKSLIQNVQNNQKNVNNQQNNENNQQNNENNQQDNETPSIKFNYKIEAKDNLNIPDKQINDIQQIYIEQTKEVQNPEDKINYGDRGQRLSKNEYFDEFCYNKKINQNQSDYFNYNEDDDNNSNDVYQNGYFQNQNQNQNQIRISQQSYPRNNSYYAQNVYEDIYQYISNNQQSQLSKYQQQYLAQNINNNYIIKQNLNEESLNKYVKPKRMNNKQDQSQSFNEQQRSTVQQRYIAKPMRNELEIQKRLQAYEQFEEQYRFVIPPIFKTPYYLNKTPRQRFFQHLTVTDYYAVAMMYELLGTQQLVADLIDTSLPNIKKILTYVKQLIEQGLFAPENGNNNFGKLQYY